MKQFRISITLLFCATMALQMVLAQTDPQLEERSFFRNNTQQQNGRGANDNNGNANGIGNGQGTGLNNNPNFDPTNPDDDPDNPVIDAIPVDSSLILLLAAGVMLGVWRLYGERAKKQEQVH